MTLNYFEPFRNKHGKWCPGIKPQPLDDASLDVILANPRVKELCDKYQHGDKDAKTQLPAICWCGVCKEGTTRKAENMVPTQLYMVDIDKTHPLLPPVNKEGGYVTDSIEKEEAHRTDPIENVRAIWDNIRMQIVNDMNTCDYGILLAHITPSGNGLRIVARALQDFPTLQEHMDWLCNSLNLAQYGEVDGCVKDVSRLSFAVPEDYILYRSTELFADPTTNNITTTNNNENNKNNNDQETEKDAEEQKEGMETQQANVEDAHKAEYDSYQCYQYRGHLVTDIIEKYVEEYGTPSDGERHNYYNNMVKNFRTICDNNVRVLHALLPRFGHTYEETLSQVQSICRSNTISRIPKDFFYFLKNNGFYEKQKTQAEIAEDAALMDAPIKENKALDKMPPLPPVFREIVGTMPKDYIVPTINALMPIMGTLTSHLRAIYPLNHSKQSTEFFSIVYAPASVGKSWMEPWMELLHEDLALRDQLADERDNLYNKIVSRKGSNEKSPDNPRVTKRITYPKTSETEFLEKQQNNKEHHMFTYASEMDTWRKGVKAAGGNKDDMIRIAWDNGKYGQSFKSANSFKGVVRLFWNVFICGTRDQVDEYFKNVENGLVTRCCFSTIENQEFVDAQEYKPLNKKGMDVVRGWMKRMDAANYKTPLDFNPDLLYSISEEDFDKEVPWKYEFNPVETVDISWVMPTIRKFLLKELKDAALDVDHAKDTFRKRVAVRGFRLALLCTTLYKKLADKEKKAICKFVEWWMPQDLRGIMNIYGDKYNAQYDKSNCEHITQKGLYDSLSETFTRADVYAMAKKLGKKTRPKQIIYDWRKLKVIDAVRNEAGAELTDKYIKVKKV